MEKFPQSNENQQERPQLDINLSGPDGNIYMVITKAREQLTGKALMGFNEDIWMATQVGAGKNYTDILDIVNSYMALTDTSAMYEAYAPKPPEE